MKLISIQHSEFIILYSLLRLPFLIRESPTRHPPACLPRETRSLFHWGPGDPEDFFYSKFYIPCSIFDILFPLRCSLHSIGFQAGGQVPNHIFSGALTPRRFNPVFITILTPSASTSLAWVSSLSEVTIRFSEIFVPRLKYL